MWMGDWKEAKFKFDVADAVIPTQSKWPVFCICSEESQRLIPLQVKDAMM